MQENTLANCLQGAEKSASSVTKIIEKAEEQLHVILGSLREAKRSNRETHHLIKMYRKAMEICGNTTAQSFLALGFCLIPFLLVCLLANSYIKPPTKSEVNEKNFNVKQHATINQFDVDFKIAILAQKSADFKTALTHYDLVLKNKPNLISALEEKAYCHFKLNEDNNAIETCNCMLEMTNYLSGRAYYLKGLVYDRKNMKVKALHQFKLAAMNGEDLAVGKIRWIESN